MYPRQTWEIKFTVKSERKTFVPLAVILDAMSCLKVVRSRWNNM